MRSTKSALLSSVFLASLALSACGAGVYYGYNGPPPPPPRFGVAGVAPGPGFVWIDGFYDLRGSTWVWRPGYWARPPHRGMVWVRPNWEHHGHGYRFHRGYWRR